VIRPATRADIPDIVDLGVRHWGESRYGQWMAPNREVMASLARALIEGKDALVLVDEQAGAIVGMIGVAVTAHIYSGEPVMSELFWYAPPESRGSGVRLLRRAESWARGNGVKHAAMIAPDERVAAFYERMGYAPLEINYIKPL
jgi:GNAT superfamily N-acetyltransferase